MAKKSGSERRETIRARRVLSVEHKLIKSRRKNTDKESHLSATEDMSLGGLAFITDVEYSLGDLLQVRVVMSGVLEIFDGPAKIVRIHKKKTGAVFLTAIKFVKAQPRSRSAKSYSPTKTKKKKTKASK